MLKQPVGFVKLTNVALIKYKSGGKRFEIACYRNKVVDWRNGLEKNMEEVLQTFEIYSNAVTGELASGKDLVECFPNLKKEEIIGRILDHGEFQVSQKEREVLTENVYNDIINILSTKVIYPKSKKLVSIEQIKTAIKELNFHPNYTQPAKMQALTVLNQLEENFNVTRTMFLIKIVADKTIVDEMRALFPMEVVQTNPDSTICLISSKFYPNFQARAKENNIDLVVINNSYYNKEQADLDDEDIVLRHKEPKKSDEKEESKKDSKTKKINLPKSRKRSDNVTEEEQTINIAEAKIVEPKDSKAGMDCLKCIDASFSNGGDYREHLKSDWHKFNLTEKMKGGEPVSFSKFQELELMLEMMKKDKKDKKEKKEKKK